MKISGRLSNGLNNIEYNEPADVSVSIRTNQFRVVIPGNSGFRKSEIKPERGFLQFGLVPKASAH